MNELIKKCLKIIGVYIGYLVLTVIAFYITGMYAWNMFPTKLVLARMIIFPIFLTLVTTLFIWIIKKIKNKSISY